VPAPSRHELIAAFEFPLLMAPVLLLSLRYRIFFWQRVSMNLRDQVDYSPELWRLSAYVTALFVAAAYPLSLARYRGWFWTEHRALLVSALFLWTSLCTWVLVRHFSVEKHADDQLHRELESISNGTGPISAGGSPRWLRIWGWSNCVILLLFLVAMLRVLLSLP
jgi:hypothetical protein